MKEAIIHQLDHIWYEVIGIHVLQKPLEPSILHVEYSIMHLKCYISEYIWQIHLGKAYSTEKSKWDDIGIVKGNYGARNYTYYFQPVVRHTIQYTGLDNTKKPRTHHTLQCKQHIESMIIQTLLSAMND